LPLEIPQQIARRRVQRLDPVAGIRQEHHAIVNQRSPLLRSFGHAARPNQLEIRDVAAVDLVERAVAPAIQRAPPHQPIRRIGLREHLAGDGRDRARGLRQGGGSQGNEKCGSGLHGVSLDHTGRPSATGAGQTQCMRTG